MLAWFLISLFLLVLIQYLIIYTINERYILKIDQVEEFKYALVLGAGLERNGKPSDILMDRILSAMDVFHTHRAEYLVMSGSHRKEYDEAGAMQSIALSYGIPPAAILVDRHGNSTLQSCINVQKEHSPSSVLIITQRFHLPRAIMLQRLLGIKAYGLAANNFRFSILKVSYWYFRELFALPFNFLKYLIYLISR